MDKERLQELAALNAVGALDGADAEEYRRLLADCAFLRHEINAFDQVVTGLAQSIPATATPPPSLKKRIFDKLGPPSNSERIIKALSRSIASRSEGFSSLLQAASGEWMKLSLPGASYKLLSLDQQRGYAVALGKLEPGASYPSHHHHGGEDLFLLSGDLKIGDQVLHAGDYHHAASETTHPANVSEHGCTLLMVISTESLLAQMAAE